MFDEKQVRQILRSISVLAAQALAMLDDLQLLRLIWDANVAEKNSGSPNSDDSVVILQDFRKKTSEANCIFEFSAEEVSKMPKEFRNFFRYGGKNHRIRKKENGVYEIRFMYKGITISASSKKLDQAKKKFIEQCHAVSGGNTLRVADRKTLKEFALFWLENVKNPEFAREQCRITKYRSEFISSLSLESGISCRSSQPKLKLSWVRILPKVK